MMISVRREFLLGLLNEVNRTRALTDGETDILVDLVKSPARDFRWTIHHDVALKTASHSKGGIRRFARRYGMSENAAYQRLYRLRQRKERKAAREQQEG